MQCLLVKASKLYTCVNLRYTIESVNASAGLFVLYVDIYTGVYRIQY